MEVGDLISFKPIFSHEDDWSNFAIVIEKLTNDNLLWKVWCDGVTCYLDEAIHEVLYYSPAGT